MKNDGPRSREVEDKLRSFRVGKGSLAGLFRRIYRARIVVPSNSSSIQRTGKLLHKVKGTDLPNHNKANIFYILRQTGADITND